MATRVSIRELRNHTNNVIEQARSGEVILTRHGRDIATIRALPDTWSTYLDGILVRLPPPRDTGLLDELAADDAASMGDLS